MDRSMQDFLHTRLVLNSRIRDDLADGRWESWLSQISTMPAGKGRSNIALVNSIRNNNNSGYRRAEEAIGRVSQWIFTVSDLCISLDAIGLQRLADEIRAEATGVAQGFARQGPVTVTINNIIDESRPLPSAAQQFNQVRENYPDLLGTPTLATESVDRTDHADIFYNGDFFALIRIPRSVKVEDETRAFLVPGAAVEFLKTKKRAVDEANARYNRDIENAGGDAAKVTAGYVVMRVLDECAWFPEPKELKSLGRANPRAAKK